MNYEKRLFLAIGLSMGILLLWSTLTPPPMQRPTVPDRSAVPELKAPVESLEPTDKFQLGSYHLEIGSIRGGIRSLTLEGEPLILDAVPGLLELSEAGREGRLELETRLMGGELISEGWLPESKVRIGRRIGWQLSRHPHLLEVVVELRNESGQPIDGIGLEMVVYRPLVALNEEGKRYLAGMALTEKKESTLRVRPGQDRSLPDLPNWVVSQGKSQAVVAGIPALEGGLFHVEHRPGGQPVGQVQIGSIRLEPGQQREWKFPLYAGPMVLAELKKLGMEETLSFGAFSGITRWLLRFISWSERRFHSYGWAICFLSLAVWLPFSPLTLYGMRISQQMTAKMAAVKPQEARIRKEHKANPQKMQKELMDLYRKHGVNPAGGCIGCLPLLLTWPIYIALFQVLTRAPELRGASFFWIRDLALPDGLIRFPTDLPILGDHLNVLPFLAAAGTFLQQKAMRRPALELTDEQRMQQQMMKILPLMFVLIFYSLPAGFMLYWVINSLLMGGQQILISRMPHG